VPFLRAPGRWPCRGRTSQAELTTVLGAGVEWEGEQLDDSPGQAMAPTSAPPNPFTEPMGTWAELGLLGTFPTGCPWVTCGSHQPPCCPVVCGGWVGKVRSSAHVKASHFHLARKLPCPSCPPYGLPSSFLWPGWTTPGVACFSVCLPLLAWAPDGGSTDDIWPQEKGSVSSCEEWPRSPLQLVVQKETLRPSVEDTCL
jgi:hypothetical protein